MVLLNRTPERAQEVAAAIASPHCIADALDQIGSYAEHYDILINATPADLPVDPDFIKAGMIVMDIRSKPLITPFLSAAQARGAVCIPGYRMFIHQAVEQFKLWFGSAIDTKVLLKHLDTAAKKVFGG